MAVTRLGAAQSDSFTTVQGSPSDHTASAGSDRKLLVGVFVEIDPAPAPVPSAITYGGQSLALLADVSVVTTPECRMQVWELRESGIAAASSAAFSVTWGATPAELGFITQFIQDTNQSVAQVDVDEGTATASSTVSAAAALTTAADGLGLIFGHSGETRTFDGSGNGWTGVITESDMASSSAWMGSQATSGANVTAGYTASASTNRLSVIGITFGPPAAGGTAVKDIIGGYIPHAR